MGLGVTIQHKMPLIN